MQAIIFVLFVPLILLNMLSGLVGGIWLAFQGEWALVGFGVLYMIIAPFFLGLAMLPSLAFGAPAAMAAERNHPIVAILVGLPAIIWTFAVIALSCVWSFEAAAVRANDALIPHVLWGYAVALAPWMYMASKEDRAGSGTSVPIFFAQLGTISMAIATLTNPDDTSFLRLLMWFLPFAVAGLCVQLLAVVLTAVSYRRHL